MRKRRSTPSPTCSIRNSRRNRAAAALTVGLWLILGTAPAAHAQMLPATSGTVRGELEAVSGVEGKRVFVSLVYRWGSSREFFEPIEAGLKSKLVFTLRLFEKREGIFSFLGDILLLEKTVSFIGYKDFYENVYVLEEEGGRVRTFAVRETFFTAFFSLNRCPLDDFLRLDKGERSYLSAQGKLYPVNLVAPLTLAYIFSQSGVFESGWHMIQIGRRR